MNFRLTTKVCVLLVALALLASVASAAPTKYDFLNVTRQECGITSCTTYYTATNPTASTITVTNAQILKVAGKTDFLGTDLGFTTEILNASNQWQDVSTITSITATPSQKVYFRIRGSFIPVYPNRDTVKYAIDHYPSFYGNTYPEYDLWNQTWNKCIDVNITYNLGIYSMINETFPQRVYLNVSNINLSAVRNDWGDLRFAKGTCGNVSSDYNYNLVYANSTNAEAIVMMNAGDIVNNTPARMAIYYNNSAVTHVEQGNTANNWGNGAVYSVRIFTNDKNNDNDTVSYDSFNETTNPLLNTFGTSNKVRFNGGYEKQIGTNSLLYTSLPMANDDLSSYRGFSSAFTFRIYNSINAPGTYYLWNIGNVTDNFKTNILRAYVVIT